MDALQVVSLALSRSFHKQGVRQVVIIGLGSVKTVTKFSSFKKSSGILTKLEPFSHSFVLPSF